MREDSAKILQISLTLIGPVEKCHDFQERQYWDGGNADCQGVIDLGCLSFTEDVVESYEAH